MTAYPIDDRLHTDDRANLANGLARALVLTGAGILSRATGPSHCPLDGVAIYRAGDICCRPLP